MKVGLLNVRGHSKYDKLLVCAPLNADSLFLIVKKNDVTFCVLTIHISQVMFSATKIEQLRNFVVLAESFISLKLSVKF